MNTKNDDSLSEVHGSINTGGKTGWRKLFAFIGPAYLVSVGYMDPGNWATDIAGGSQFGYKLIWVLLMSNLMALLLQSLSARLGIVRGLDLAQASRNTYPAYINYPLYVLAQIAIVACDLAEIIGMAIGLNLLFGLPLIWGISITILDTFLLLFLMNKGMRMMEVFIVSMVFIVGISFLTEMLIVKPLLGEVISGFKPSILTGNALYIAIGIIGATVMPHNLYLHSSLVQTRKIERTPQGIKESLKYNFIDTAIALLRIQPWIRRLLTRMMAIIPAFYTILYFGEGALGGLLVLSQVVLSLQLGFAVIPLIHFNSDQTKMKEYAIKTWVKILAWLTALIIVSLNVQLVIEEIGSWLKNTTINVWWIYLLVIPVVVLIFALLVYVFIMPFFKNAESHSSNVPHGEALEIGEIQPIQYHKVGISVDFSKNDRNTLRHALLQSGKDAEYHLIHIVETAGARFHGEKVLDHETQSDTDNLEKYKLNLEELGYKITIAIGYGTAAKAISEIVKERELDLLVMGAHGHSGLSDLIFGTTVEKVRHNVNIPIMIVK